MPTTRKISTQHLVFMALMIALNIILSRFLSIAAWNLKIGFAFVPVVLTALYLGKWQAGIVAAIADFLGAILFPIGQYFPGFTLTAFLVGFAYGYFLHEKQTMLRIVAVIFLTELIGSLLLNTFWISVLYGSPFLPLIATRVVQCLIMGIVEIVAIRALVAFAPRIRAFAPIK